MSGRSDGPSCRSTLERSPIAIGSASSTSGTWTMKIDCQLIAPVITPPITGPIVDPATPAAAHRAAPLRSS